LVKDSPESLPGEPQKGRPKLSKDSNKRKTKTFSPQTGAKLLLWSAQSQDKINEIINPIMLEFFSKKNLRSLSNEQHKELENLKTGIFFNLKPFCTISKESILDSIPILNHQVINEYSVWLRQLSSTLDRDLTVEDQKQAKSSFYSFLKTKA
jgi:hypothetical protein